MTPPAVEYRDVPGFPGYRLGSDRSLWSCRPDALWLQNHPGVAKPWTRRRRAPRGRQRAWYALWRDGRGHQLSIVVLMRMTFGDATGPALGPAARGEDHGRARLDERKVAEARRLHEHEGWSERRLAARFGVSPATIHYALTGATWRHVLPEDEGRPAADPGPLGGPA